MTIVEVVVAAVILTISAAAVLALMSTASRTNYRAQESQVVSDLLQRELEKAKQMPFSEVALTSLPTHSADPSNPNYRVSGSQFNVNSTGTPSSWGLVYNGGHSSETGGTVSLDSGQGLAPSSTFTSGNVHGTVYRYVVWMPETSCSNCGHFPGSDSYNGQPMAWYKRVVMVAALDTTASGGTRAYQEIHTDIGNPQGGGTDVSNNPATPWTFYLTDTPCSRQSGYTETRQALTGAHRTHNTRGNCSSNGPGTPTTGNSPGPPDLMFTEGAPCAGDPADCSIENNPLYDYSTDVEPGCGTVDCASTDSGLQLLNGPSCSGLLNNLTQPLVFGTLPLVGDVLDSSFYEKVHKWVSPPIPNGSDILFNGDGHLFLWTRSVGGVSQPGKVCAYLFYRQVSVNGLGVQTVVDTPAVNLDLSNATYFTHSQGTWPTTWTTIDIPLHFDLGAHLLPGTRLGVAISVDGANGNTGPGGLEFAYDHPTYDSRLELETNSVLPF